MNRVFLTVDVLVLSILCLTIAIFLLEGSPGPFTTKLASFATEVSYSLLGPDLCESYVCYSNLRNSPNTKSKSWKPVSLGNFINITGCEAACIKYKASNQEQTTIL